MRQRTNGHRIEFRLDASMAILLVLTIFAIFDLLAQGANSAYAIYAALFAIGLVLLGVPVYSALGVKDIKSQSTLLILDVSAVALISIVFGLYNLNLSIWEQNLIIATTENLWFATLLPGLVASYFSKQSRLPVKVATLFITTLFFTALHRFRYSGTELVLLFVIGLLVMFLGYTVPSAGIILHWMNNLIAIAGSNFSFSSWTGFAMIAGAAAVFFLVSAILQLLDQTKKGGKRR